MGSGFSALGYIDEPASQSCVSPVGERKCVLQGPPPVLQRPHTVPWAALVPGRLRNPCAGLTLAVRGPSPGLPSCLLGSPSCSISWCLDIKGRNWGAGRGWSHCLGRRIVASGNLFRAYLQSDVWTGAVSSALPERMHPSGGVSSVGPWPDSQEVTRFRVLSVSAAAPGSSKVHEGRPSKGAFVPQGPSQAFPHEGRLADSRLTASLASCITTLCPHPTWAELGPVTSGIEKLAAALPTDLATCTPRHAGADSPAQTSAGLSRGALLRFAH